MISAYKPAKFVATAGSITIFHGNLCEEGWKPKHLTNDENKENTEKRMRAKRAGS